MTAGNWTVIRAAHNYRVFNARTGEYHRGSNGAVRVYTSREPAQRRAARLNGAKPAPVADELAAQAMTYALIGGEQ